MKRLTICLLFILFVFAGELFAGEIREIELNDGSVLYGEVVSLKDGVYTLKMSSLGIVTIEDSKIKAIRNRTPIKITKEQIQTMQQLMLNDKEILNMLTSLKNDPDVQKILEDPDLMKAINSGDMEALMSNPKFMKLLSNPTILNIKKKVVK